MGVVEQDQVTGNTAGLHQLYTLTCVHVSLQLLHSSCTKCYFLPLQHAFSDDRERGAAERKSEKINKAEMKRAEVERTRKMITIYNTIRIHSARLMLRNIGSGAQAKVLECD